MSGREAQPRARVWRVGDLELDLEAREVRRDGVDQGLRPQSFEVLALLFEERHRLVSQDELLEGVWGDVSVTPDSLTQCIADIRRTFGDDSRNPHTIRTVPRRGYRFIADVHAVRDHGESIAKTAPVKNGWSRLAKLLLASALPASAALVALLVVFGGLRRFEIPSPDQASLPVDPLRHGVAVLAMENLSDDPELEWLATGLRDILVSELSASPPLGLLSREHVNELFDRIRLPEDAPLSQQLGVLHQYGVSSAVVGSYSATGEEVRLDLRLHDCESGVLLATESTTSRRSGQLLGRLQLLARRVGTHLDPSWAGDANEGRFTTDIEAFRLYSHALAAADGYESERALELLERALEIDPDFVLARARIGYVLGVVSWRGDEALPHLERAFENRGELSDRTRRQLLAWYALVQGDFETASGAYRDLLQRYPHEVEAYWRLGQILRGEGRLEDAIEVLEEGLVVDPDNPEIHNILGFVQAEAGRVADAIATHRRYVELDPTEGNAYDSLGMTLDWSGRYEEAIAAYDRAIELGSPPAAWHRQAVRYRLGHWRETLAFLRDELENGRDSAPHLLNRMAIIQYRAKDFDGFRESVAAFDEYRPVADPLRIKLLSAIERSDAIPALAVNRRSAHGMRLSRRGEQYSTAIRLLAAGRTEEGLDALRNMVRERPHLGELWIEHLLATELLSLGRAEEAYTELSRILRLNDRYPRGHYFAAEACAFLGQAECEEDHLRKFVQHWLAADEDIPELVDARSRLEALGGLPTDAATGPAASEASPIR